MRLSREEAFDLWAGSASPWCVWSKPILLAYLPAELTADAAEPRVSPKALPSAPPADGSVIVVVDLPGVESVRVGETLAHAGFRPIPLFNAVPGPWWSRDRDSRASFRPVVDVWPIVDAIEQVTLRLRERLEGLPSAAPPAFLLDSNRRLGETPRPGDFDNRSVSLPTDFPSAVFLQSRGVTRVIVVYDSADRTSVESGQPASDLAHTLLRWQNAGIAILACPLDESLCGADPAPIVLTRPSWFGMIWHGALSVLGLRRNPLGGFGGTLPVPSGG
jgi:hypothetical protein